MKLLTVLAATAVAAAVAAALSIPAGADQSAGSGATKLATCLHAHGAADAPSDALGLKRWLATHADSAAVAACQPQSAAPAGLASCLRAHGLNPPENLFQLKSWMVRQAGTDAGKAALGACRVSFDAPQGAAPDKPLAACLRSHGVKAPAGADGLALKTWVRDPSSDTKLMDALKLCGGGVMPAMAKDCGGAGAGAPAPAQKPAGGTGGSPPR